MPTYYKRDTNPTNNNWNQANNWSTVSSTSATNTGTFPSSSTADPVIFDANSIQVTVNVASTCTSLNFTGYTNTITMTNGITVGGSVTLSAGMTISGSGNLNIIANATLTSNGKTFPNTLIVGSGSPGFSATLADNWTVGGLTSSGNTANLIGNTIFVTGDVSLNGGLLSSTTTNIELNGTGTQTLSGTGTPSFPCQSGININKPSGQFVLSGSFSWRGMSGKTFKYTTSGSTSTTSSTLGLSGGGTGGTLDTGGSSGLILNNLQGGNGFALHTYTLGSDVYLDGNFTSSGNGIGLTGAYKIFIKGNFTKGSPFTNGGTFAGIEFNGTGSQIWGDTYGSGIYLNFDLIINKATGTLTLGTTTTQTVLGVATNRTLTHTAGTLDPQNTTFSTPATVTYNISTSGFILYNWSPLTGTHTINTGTITVNNNLRFDGNTTFAGTGRWTANDLTDSTAGRTLTLKDGSTYTVTGNLALTGTNASRWTIASSSATLRAILTLNQGASQSLIYVNGTRIDSGAGQTVWSLGGTLTDTINWNNGSRPAAFNSIRMG